MDKLVEGLRIRVYQVRRNTIFRIWHQNVKQNLLCLVPKSTMLIVVATNMFLHFSCAIVYHLHYCINLHDYCESGPRFDYFSYCFSCIHSL